MKVAKFGGSSVSNATQIKKVLNIVNEDDERKIIIVSAPGKRHKDDIKTTDLLIRLYEKVLNGLDYQDKKKEIIQRYADILEELEMDMIFLTTIDETLEHIIKTLKNEPLVYMMLYYRAARILMLN
ncbi:hypothetical protein GCM10007342_04530 [Staphylococcus pragensis]|nr:hypothetical protein GCM10007342_04530 [Staphylococcus pragensis]